MITGTPYLIDPIKDDDFSEQLSQGVPIMVTMKASRTLLLLSLLIFLLSATDAWAPLEKWQQVDDPTFSGFINEVFCDEDLVVSCRDNWCSISRGITGGNSFKLNIQNRTVEFNKSGKILAVNIVSALKSDFGSKSLRISSCAQKCNIRLDVYGNISSGVNIDWTMHQESADSRTRFIHSGSCVDRYRTR